MSGSKARSPRRDRHRALAVAILAASFGSTSIAQAQPAPPAPSPSAAPAPGPAPAPAAPPAAPGPPSTERAAAAAAEAKELNKQGITLLDAGDLERALDHFVRSRKVLATTKNTTNTAIALDRLGRFDEALELYEELLLKYAGGLDDEDRAAIAPAMAELRGKVGSIAVSSSAGGTVFVDGRRRAELPITIPIRVLPGKHTVRVVRAGFRDFEGGADVAAGRQVAIEANLTAMEGVGVLSVATLDVSAADVFVDGVKLGTTPWEGAVPPGQHLVWLAAPGEHGTAPAWVQVVGGQSALVRLAPQPLGPPLTVTAEPKTATIEIDGVRLGSSRWEGRLPAGTHQISVAEAGYHSVVRRVDLPRDGGAVTADVRLEIDPTHPRWPRAKGSFLIELYGGPLVGPTLAGEADADCPDRCDDSGLATGVSVGARGGYRFPFGLAIELGGGYLALGQDIARTETDTFGDVGTVITYRLDDETAMHGPFFTASASYRKELGNFYLGGRGTVGVVVATSSDPVSGTASTTGPSVPITIQDPEASAVAAAPFLAPEAIGGVRLGPIDLGVGLGIAVFPALGPRVDRGRFGPTPREGVTDPAAVENAQESDVIADERTYGRFWVFSPSITAAATF